MNLFLFLVLAAVLAGLYLNWRLSRQQAQRAAARDLQPLLDEYARAAGRVVDLFGAVERARPGDGRTAAAFAAVERAFAAASGLYQGASVRVEAIRKAAARGDFRPLTRDGAAARDALAKLATALGDLEAQLAAYQARWRAAPAEVDAARQAVADLLASAAAAEAELGFPLPIRPALARLEQFVATAAAEASTNPVAATARAADLQQNLSRYTADVDLYRSGHGAMAQAAQELAALQAGPAGTDPGCAEHLAQAAALLETLRPHLQAGRLEHFQQALLQFHNALRAARRVLRAGGGTPPH